MTVAITGGAGFIGGNLADYLYQPRIVEQGDPFDFTGADTVIHLAANADVRHGWDNPTLDLQDNLFLTSQVLEAMREQGVRRLIFASTGSVYAPRDVPLVEQNQLRATSLYAASKIAAEQLIWAYQAAGHIYPTILRFVSVLGPGLHRGLVYDFVQKLGKDPTCLGVIAPGTSQKSYIHVQDICRAILTVHEQPHPRVYNVGTDTTATPLQIAAWVADQMGLTPEITLEGETWIGDNPHILLNTDRLRKLGWAPQHTIEQAVRDAVDWLT